MTIPAPGSESDGNQDARSGSLLGKYLLSVSCILDTILGPIYGSEEIHAWVGAEGSERQ